MSYYQTIYTRGERGHIHVASDRSRIVCFTSHKKPDYFKLWITIAGLVELAIIFALINRAW